MRQWQKNLSPKIAAVSAVATVIGAALVGLMWRHASHLGADPNTGEWSPSTINTSAFAQPKAYPCPIAGDFKEVDLPIAMVCDFYEHLIEHMPPRQSGGGMQRRERFYVAPHEPFELLESRATSSTSDKEMIAALHQYSQKWRSGSLVSDSETAAFSQSVDRSSVTSDAVIDCARAFNWLMGDKVAAQFFNVGIAKATQEYLHVVSGDPVAQPLLHALEQSKALWRLADHRGLERRFSLATRLAVPLSVEARRSATLHAESLWHSGQFQDAADAITAVAADDEQVGDLGRDERSDLLEMHRLQGVLYLAANRYKQAVPHLRACLSSPEKDFVRFDWEMLIRAEASAGMGADAKADFKRWQDLYRPSSYAADNLYEVIETSALSDATRQGSQH